ncbi:hypothetical protein [Desulfosporosinus sp. BICA1-9]|uniref:hypothetical protein n=1 Tax=Desulfosporosinus sp. BICA1-9 TaxID=1531958 RepID=UPI000AEE14BC|nr:hypothetical protein [Desulfosporosinus sp. BICA1-9]HBW35401.1 hypothetical protein [Desulfosporosinus sp.]
MNKKRLLLLVSSLLMVALVVVGCGKAATPAPAPTPAPVQQAAAPDLAAKVDALQKSMDVQTKTINPSTATVMLEYNQRFAALWYAAQAQNWDLAAYEAKEMGGVQAVAENTRPKRAEALQAFKKNTLEPLQAVVAKKDKAAFEVAYDKTIASCNTCHAVSDKKYIKIQRPTQVPASNVDYAGQK